MNTGTSSGSTPIHPLARPIRGKASRNVSYRGPADPALGSVSLVLPVRNESFIIEQTLRNYIAELAPRIADFEVVVAEDGSSDDTKAILERLSEELPIRLYIHDERKGYQQAIIDAVSLATKEWVLLVDSDYQFAAIDFWRLEPYRAECDIILGRKAPRRDPLHRIWLSAGYNFLLRRFFHLPYRDMDTGFRLIRKTALDQHATSVRHMCFFTAEFVVRAHLAGWRIMEVPVPHYERKIGSTSIFFLSSLFGICINSFLGLLALHRELRGQEAVTRESKSPES